MSDDALCKKAGCGHPLSVHTLSRAEKYAKIRGTALSDWPSTDPRDFNSQAGRSNTSCVEPGCGCLAYQSPYA